MSDKNINNNLKKELDITIGIDIGNSFYSSSISYFNEYKKEFSSELIPNDLGNRMTEIPLDYSIENIIETILLNIKRYLKNTNFNINQIIISNDNDNIIINYNNISKKYLNKIFLTNETNSILLYFQKNIIQNILSSNNFNKNKNKNDNDNNNNSIIIDIGGTNMKIYNINFEYNFEYSNFINKIISYKKFNKIGGKTIDNILLQHLLNIFNTTNNENLKINEYNNNNFYYNKLIFYIIRAKNILSNENEILIEIDNFYNNKNLYYNLNINEFNQILKKFFYEEIILNINLFINEHKIKDKINNLFLCGGAMKIPKLKNDIEKYFYSKNNNINIYTVINCDEIISIGNSLFKNDNIFTINNNININNNNNNDKNENKIIVNENNNNKNNNNYKLKFSIGIRTEGDLMTFLLKKNSKFPIKFSKNFITTEHNQTIIKFSIYFGEHLLIKKNKLIKTFILNIKKINKNKEKGELNINVIFNINSNGNFFMEIFNKKYFIGNVFDIENKINNFNNNININKVNNIGDITLIEEKNEFNKIKTCIDISRSIEMCIKSGKIDKNFGNSQIKIIKNNNKNMTLNQLNEKKDFFKSILFNKTLNSNIKNINNNNNLMFKSDDNIILNKNRLNFNINNNNFFNNKNKKENKRYENNIF